MADDEDTEAEAAPTKTKTRRKLLVLALAGVLVLGAAAVGGAWMLGLFGDGADTPQAGTDGTADGVTEADDGVGTAAAAGPEVEPIFVDLPQMLVNLVSDGHGTRFLKLTLAVEVADAATAERIERLTPRIVDGFQLYLRTLTPDELRGPGSMFRLKEDLHVRIHQAIEPAEVRDVLFKEMLVQ